jgi:hypothetical protein
MASNKFPPLRKRSYLNSQFTSDFGIYLYLLKKGVSEPNPYCRARLSTTDLHIKIPCCGKEEKIFFSTKSS